MATARFMDMWAYMRIYTFEVNPDSVVEDLKCIICKRLMIDACRSSCGCQYCYKCIDHYLSDGDKYCPGKRKSCQEEFLRMVGDVTRNREMNNRISVLKVLCPNHECKAKMELRNAGEHLRLCIKDPIACPYAPMGCDKRDTDKDSMLIHMNDNALTHTELLIQWLDHLKNDGKDNFEMSKSETADLQKKVAMLENRIVTLKEESSSKDIQMRWMSVEMTSLKSDIESMKKGSIKMKNTVDSLEKQLNTYIKEVEHRLETNEANAVRSTGVTKKQIDSLCDSIKRNNISMNTKIAAGMITFNVDRFSERLDKEEILTPYFYSHKNGYKLRLQIFPRSPYSDTSIYLALFVNICKGEYDHALPWPCRYSIKVSLVNQHSGDDQVTQSYNYSTILESSRYKFNKPINESNDSSGYGRFVSHSDLKSLFGCIINDVVVIRCVVTASM